MICAQHRRVLLCSARPHPPSSPAMVCSLPLLISSLMLIRVISAYSFAIQRWQLPLSIPAHKRHFGADRKGDFFPHKERTWKPHIHKILETAPTADPNTVTISNQPRGNEVPVTTLTGRTLQSLGLKCVPIFPTAAQCLCLHISQVMATFSSLATRQPQLLPQNPLHPALPQQIQRPVESLVLGR